MNEIKIDLTNEQRNEIKQIKLKHGNAFYYLDINSDLKRWEGFVKRCELGYNDNIEEYTNLLSTRDHIQFVIDDLSDRQLTDKIQTLVKPWDDRFMTQLVETDKCIHRAVSSCPLPKEKYFWVWGIIRNAKGRMLESLTSEYAPVKYDLYNKYGHSRRETGSPEAQRRSKDELNSAVQVIQHINIDNLASFKPNLFHAIQLALLGEITCNVRGVTLGWNEQEKVVFIRWVLENITESEMDSINEVEKLMMARYPEVTVYSEYNKLEGNERPYNYCLMDWVYFKKIS